MPLIDKQATIENVKSQALSIRDAIRIIDEMPNIKAYPEQTAKLQRTKCIGTNDAQLKCTRCTWVMPKFNIPNDYNFCPRCGAKFAGMVDTRKDY